MSGIFLLVFSLMPGVLEDSPPPRLEYIERVEVELEEPLPLPIILWDEAREEWLGDLILCESGGNPNALNPVDNDGTPSHGLLQFKDTTFTMYSERYGVKGELYDPEVQKQLVRFMMDDSRVNWFNEFPACVRRLGLPPGV